jgi:glycosyltransferase involved in cell wall biosynthesis
MRLCFIAHQATKEGAGRFMLDQIDYLVDRGVTPFVILPNVGQMTDALAARNVEMAIVPNAWWNKPQQPRTVREYLMTLGAAHRMAGWFRRWKIEIAYTHTIVSPAGALAASLTGLPHIWHLHEFSYNPRAIDMAIGQRTLTRLMDRTSNYIFFNSKAIAKEWDGRFATAKTRVVYNWTSATLDNAPPETADPVALSALGDPDMRVVVIVGSVIPLKRPIDAVRAVGNLVNEGIRVVLLIVGPLINEAYRAELQGIVQTNGWENNIRFLGYSENAHRFMREADVTVVCSDSESFGRVTVESMAEGTPVVGADFGGTREIIDDGIDGFLFPPGDVGALTDRLRSLIQSEPLRRQVTSRASEKAKQFRGPDASMRIVVDALQSLAGRRNPSWPFGRFLDFGLSAMKGVRGPRTGSHD